MDCVKKMRRLQLSVNVIPGDIGDKETREHENHLEKREGMLAAEGTWGHGDMRTRGHEDTGT